MKEPQASDGIVAKPLLQTIQARVPTAAMALQRLVALGKREPHLQELCLGSLVALGRTLRRMGAPRDAVEVASAQLGLLTARLLGALRLADHRYRRRTS